MSRATDAAHNDEKPNKRTARYLDAKDVADELGVSLTSAYAIMREAGLQPIRGLVKVSRENLEAWLKAQRESKAREPLEAWLSAERARDSHETGRATESPSPSREGARTAPPRRREPEPLIRPTKWRVKKAAKPTNEER